MKILIIILQVIVGLLALVTIFNIIKNLTTVKTFNNARKLYLLNNAGKQTILQPCPFCGKNTISLYRTDDGTQVVCDTSLGGCGSSSGYFTIESDAVDYWNTRDGINKSEWVSADNIEG